MIMDAGRLEDLPRGVLGKRLPDWLCPPPISLAHWHKLRPDLAILPDRDMPGRPADRVIWLVELGYCSDTNHATKYSDKHAQHAQLVGYLRGSGYTVHYEVITLGTTGTIPKSILSTLRTLGVDTLAAIKMADKIHTHTISCFTTILKSRRYMESNPAGIG
jgi:hypothetical protein